MNSDVFLTMIDIVGKYANIIKTRFILSNLPKIEVMPIFIDVFIADGDRINISITILF